MLKLNKNKTQEKIFSFSVMNFHSGLCTRNRDHFRNNGNILSSIPLFLFFEDINLPEIEWSVRGVFTYPKQVAVLF
jgi:hypothetical protein